MLSTHYYTNTQVQEPAMVQETNLAADVKCKKQISLQMCKKQISLQMYKMHPAMTTSELQAES